MACRPCRSKYCTACCVDSPYVGGREGAVDPAELPSVDVLYQVYT